MGIAHLVPKTISKTYHVDLKAPRVVSPAAVGLIIRKLTNDEPLTEQEKDIVCLNESTFDKIIADEV